MMEPVFGASGDARLLIAFIVMAVAYVALRSILSSAARRSGSYQHEVDAIVNSDKYKVKGRFE
jgi:hypothetical protein